MNARLLEEPTAILAWMACRMIDRTGSGRVITSIEELAFVLDRSVPTVKRYLASAQKLGYFRSLRKERGSGVVHIYLSSEAAIFRSRGLQVGPRIEITEDHLQWPIGALRCESVEAEALALQHRSYMAAKRVERKKPRNRREFVPNAEVLARQASLLCRGANTISTARFGNVSESTITHGGSQSTLAKRVGRNQRTIQRRLSNETRGKYRLPNLDRIQIIKALPLNTKDQGKIQFFSRYTDKLSLTAKNRTPVKIFFRRFQDAKFDDSQGKIAPICWQYAPNVYLSSMWTKPDQWLHKKLKAACGQI